MVNWQRQLISQGRISTDHLQRLDALGFEWEPKAIAWEEMFATLVQFKHRAGDCNVPQDLSYDPKLANWVIRQRQLRKQGRLSAGRIQRLDALGFEWEPRRGR